MLYFLSGGSLTTLVDAISEKILLHKMKNKETFFQNNVKEFSLRYLNNLPEKARIAAVLTQGLTLTDASELT